MAKDNSLDEVWECLGSTPTLSDVASAERGILDDGDRPYGVCWVCKKFADRAMIHESPSTAKCCKGCDAYEGEEL